jgi:hypothetical protein
MVTLSLNSEYENYSDRFIKEHGMYKYLLPPSISKPSDTLPHLETGLNTKYEKERAELEQPEMGAKSLSHQQLWMRTRVGNAEMEFRTQPCEQQYKEYVPYNLLKLSIYQHPLYIGLNTLHEDNEFTKLFNANHMNIVEIIHAPDINLPFNARKDKAAIHIQRAWRICISNPLYKMCRKRLMDEWQEDANPPP